MNRKVVVGVVLVVGLLAMTLVALYAFGTPQSPSPVASAAQPGADAQPASTQQPDVPPATDVDSSSVPEADPSVPLAIEIPGCVCHSDDPKLVKQHAKYRMNQCAGCHAGGVPTGQ